MLDALVAFQTALAATLSPRQLQLREEREAARLGVSVNEWRDIRATPVSVELLRLIHIAITGRATGVRRANEHGEWEVVPPKPGHLRSRPQAFRIGEHVEAAWDHPTLRKRIAELLRSNAIEAERPLYAVSRLIWSLLRAQPFLGSNERVALLLAARVLNAAGWPAPDIEAIEADDELAVAAAAPNHELLVVVLERAMAQEMLAFAEWLPLAREPGRWSLHDEQQAAAAARSRVTQVQTDMLVDATNDIADLLEPMLAKHFALGPRIVTTLTSEPERLEAAVTAARSGRYLCPQCPIVRCCWPVEAGHGLVVRLVAGAAGRALAGAAAIHLAIDITSVPASNAPATLLVPNESSSARQERIQSWLRYAIPRALAYCPLLLPKLG